MAHTYKGGEVPISTLIADTVARTSGNATLYGVADALAVDDIGALVVGDENRVEGIVTERDLVRALAGRQDLRTTRAIDVANTTIIWCDVEATVAEVAEQMMSRYVRHILVEDDGRLVGIVSARDLLGVYAASDLVVVDDEW